MKRILIMCAALTALVANGVSFRGSTIDENCNVVSDAVCVIYDAATNEVIDTVSTEKDGFFYVMLPDDVDWVAKVTAPGYSTATFKKEDARLSYEILNIDNKHSKKGKKKKKLKNTQILSYVFQLHPMTE